MKKKVLSILLLISILASGCSNSVSKKLIKTSNSAINPVEVINNVNTDSPLNVPFIISDDLHEEVNCNEKDTTTNKNMFINLENHDFSTKENNWYFVPNNNGTPPSQPGQILELLKKYNGNYLGNTENKELYLTFDEGYENGHTNEILDTLKKHNVKAAFFVVKPYITSNYDIIKRMADEGHLVCNHSAHHPSMASVRDFDKFTEELAKVEKEYEVVTGKKMPKYFRPPMGKYSELSLHYTNKLGYKTVFWSFAYYDWDIKKQPSHIEAKNKILSRTHNGAIILLHAVSKTNAEILDDLLTTWKSQGYTFKTLDELPK